MCAGPQRMRLCRILSQSGLENVMSSELQTEKGHGCHNVKEERTFAETRKHIATEWTICLQNLVFATPVELTIYGFETLFFPDTHIFWLGIQYIPPPRRDGEFVQRCI